MQQVRVNAAGFVEPLIATNLASTCWQSAEMSWAVSLDLCRMPERREEETLLEFMVPEARDLPREPEACFLRIILVTRGGEESMIR